MSYCPDMNLAYESIISAISFLFHIIVLAKRSDSDMHCFPFGHLGLLSTRQRRVNSTELRLPDECH